MPVRSLTSDRLDSLESLCALEPQWRELWSADSHATPFQSPEWLLPWTRCLWGGGKIAAFAFRHEGRLVGLAPFFLWGFGRQPEIIRLSFLGSGITDYLDILAADDFAAEVAAATFDCIAKTCPDWHTCDLQELPAASPLLRANSPEDLDSREAPLSACPVLKLAGSIDEHLAVLDSKFRTDLRRAENRLRRAGAVEFRTATIDDLVRLHSARWNQCSQPGMLENEKLQDFHRETFERMHARDISRLYGLFLNGECIAVQYNLSAKGRVYAYLSGFDPAHAKLSPGGVLLKHSIAEAIREGAVTFDFLRKREDFKYQWGAKDQLTRRLLISHAAAQIRGVA